MIFDTAKYNLNWKSNYEITDLFLRLAENNKITGTSVIITQEKLFPEDFKSLRQIKENRPHFQIGLHLNLTQGDSLSLNHQFDGILKLLLRLHINNAQRQSYLKEIIAQVEAFINTFGVPSHIDGHQHIQYIPKISSAINGYLNQNQFIETRKRSYPFVTNSLNLRTGILSFLSLIDRHNSGHKYKLLDLDEAILNEGIWKNKDLDHIELMAHVA